MKGEAEVLERATRYLREEVAPNAQRIDDDEGAMRRALDGLARLDLLALKRPEAYGGPALSDAGVRHFQEEIARYSGALAFLQTQHQGVVGMIAGSPNEALRDEYLPQMGDGRKLVGVGFSQLRRPGPPIMRAEPVEGGYRLEGHVPWVTGWNYFPEFMIGAGLPDGRAVFGLVPLVEAQASSGVMGMRSGKASLRISPPMRLAAMPAANTVSVDLDGFLLPESKVALVREAGWIQTNDQINIAQQGSFALGCAQAGLDVLRANAERRKLPFACDAHDRLAEELAELKRQTEASRADLSEATADARLQLRARQIDLMMRCAHAAVASSSGAANSLDHPAQRILREALVFTVSAQTGPIMQATLERIAGDG